MHMYSSSAKVVEVIKTPIDNQIRTVTAPEPEVCGKLSHVNFPIEQYREYHMKQLCD